MLGSEGVGNGRALERKGRIDRAEEEEEERGGYNEGMLCSWSGTRGLANIALFSDLFTVFLIFSFPVISC